MNSATLTFLPWARSGAQPQKPRELRVAGWNRDRTALLVYGEGGERTALRLHLPALPGMTYPDREAIFDSTPTAIRRTVLHLPPCRETSKEAEELRRFAASGTYPSGKPPELWELTAVTVITPSPEDHAPLAGLFRAFKGAVRTDTEARLAEADGVPPEERTLRTKALRGQLAAVNKATMADVLAGAFGIRDRYLCEAWAKLVGIDLNKVPRHARSFRRWLARVAVNSDALRWRDKDHRPPTLEFLGLTLHLTEDHFAALEAGVRYEITFAAGGRAWLGEVEEVCPPEARDAEDFERIEAAVDVAGAEPVTRDQCCRELGGITDRRLRQICKERRVRVPETRRELDHLKDWHDRRRRDNAARLRASNRQRKGQTRLP